VKFTENPHGLSSLKYNGQELLFQNLGGLTLVNRTQKFALGSGGAGHRVTWDIEGQEHLLPRSMVNRIS